MHTRSLLTALLVLSLSSVSYGQWDDFPGGNVINSTEYLGAAAGSLVPLRLKTVPDLSIDMYTSDIRRFTLLPDATYTIGTFGGQVRDGALLLSPDVDLFYTNSGPGPFSLLHLADGTGDNAQTYGYRPWMRNGVTFTGNSDQGYVGQKYTTDDHSDMVIQWSDNTGGGPSFGPDRMRFLFTSTPNGADSGAFSETGLEAMRMWPQDPYQVNIGLGDFHAGNLVDPALVTEPTDRLDILNGRLRIRQLPTDAEADTVNKYMVVDYRGIVRWRTLPTYTTSSCQWVSFPTTRQMVSAYANSGTNGSCPDKRWKFGLSVASPTYKFQIDHNESDETAPGGILSIFRPLNASAVSYGIRSQVLPAQDYVTAGYGLHGYVLNPGSSGYGSYGQVSLIRAGTVTTATGSAGFVEADNGTLTNAYGIHGQVDATGTTITNSYGAYCTTGGSSLVSNSFGAYGRSNPTDSVTTSYGLYGLSFVTGSAKIGTSHGVYAYSYGPVATPANITLNYGLHARAVNGATNMAVYAYVADTATNNWAGYFQGKVRISGNGYVSGNLLIQSDENLKTDIEDLADPTALLAQLHPKTYRFRTEEYGGLNLPMGQQIGLLAQNVEEVLPQLVRTVHDPAVRDTSGAVVHPAVTSKAVNYIGLIPLLIGASQEQQETIVEQAEALSAQQEAIEQLQDQMTDLQQALASCCNQQMGGGGDERLQLHDGDAKSLLGDERALLIQPNPFSTATTVRYTLEKGGRVQLMANSSDGKQLRMLQEGTMEPGQYSYDWNTAGMAPGVYYVTLLLDGEPLVKKAVKLER